MSSSTLIQRLLRRRAPAAVAASRIDIKPPAQWGQAEPVYNSLWNWLRQRPALPAAPVRVLELAREDFCAALLGIAGEDACDLQRRALHARSLRELWHLRAELYSVIALRNGQSEADLRLQGVNRHFPAHANSVHSNTSKDRHVHSKPV